MTEGGKQMRPKSAMFAIFTRLIGVPLVSISFTYTLMSTGHFPTQATQQKR